MTDGLDSLQGLNSLDSLTGLAGVVILAGGASRRMGTPKAKLTLPTNESLLDYHVRYAIGLKVPIIIADNERGFTVTPELLLNSSESSISYVADYGSTTTIGDDSDTVTGGALVAIESALQSLKKQLLVKQSLVKQPLANTTDAGTLKNEQSSWLMVISCDSLIPASDLWQKLQPYTRALTDNDIKKAQQTGQMPDKKVICLTDETHLYPLLGLYDLSIEPDLKTYIDSGERQVMAFIKPMTQAIPIVKEWQPLTNFNTPEDFKRACVALYDL
ncbi:molybdenum cofactor guanylyltransferase [Psychrobacter sp. LV10R520-6]|uniref:molybdenum cofactor guanylyltransferase n=1 Tax=Psychrobacter sp. LV10R520-6 TaxID=1415574 RepID=UPI0024CC39D9|nr:NTP transferase domain-containing protein [Psychrobacter sp. LV10R520-6]SNT70409.1 molybdenum cofactor guanylyltransferase [Psychrobacter sp. LV10R520-6]